MRESLGIASFGPPSGKVFDVEPSAGAGLADSNVQQVTWIIALVPLPR